MNKKSMILVILAIVLIGGGAYLVFANKPADTIKDVNQSPIISDDNASPGSSVNDLPVEPAAAAARKDLAVKLGVEESSIVIMQIDEVEWTDGCLGLGGIAESCLQALVPGFKVEMLAKGKTYIYRTDTAGTNIRAETK
jgi:hypothetical protein